MGLGLCIAIYSFKSQHCDSTRSNSTSNGKKTTNHVLVVLLFPSHIDPVASFRALKPSRLENFRALKLQDPTGGFSHHKTPKIGEF